MYTFELIDVQVDAGSALIVGEVEQIPGLELLAVVEYGNPRVILDGIGPFDGFWWDIESALDEAEIPFGEREIIIAEWADYAYEVGAAQLAQI